MNRRQKIKQLKNENERLKRAFCNPQIVHMKPGGKFAYRKEIPLREVYSNPLEYRGIFEEVIRNEVEAALVQHMKESLVIRAETDVCNGLYIVTAEVEA